MALPKSMRVEEIDGIRGWAALAVVVFHFWNESFGTLHPNFRQPALAFFFDGPLAVYIFFILSGDALSTPFFAGTQKIVLDRMVLKRYFRLAAPIFVITLITVAAIWLGIVNNVAAAKILHREDWIGTLLPSDFDAIDALMYPFFTVFAVGGNPKGFNPFLWTMATELRGSIFVFLYLYIHERLRYPKLVLGLLIAISLHCVDYYALFFFGVLLSHIRSTGGLKKIGLTVAARVCGPILVACAYLIEYYLRSHAPISNPANFGEWILLLTQENEKFVMSILFVSGSYMSIDLCRFFRSGISKFLGTISFSIYLLQVIVLTTLFSYLVTQFASYVTNAKACVAIALASVAATIILGYLLSIVERRIMSAIEMALARVLR